MPHKKVWDVFREKGYKAYFVGGCVRDALIGRTAKDIDIATNAMPEDVKNIFEINYDTGLKFGSVTVLYEGNYYDITTLRAENGYSDSRHPDFLEYTDDIKLDLKRRDFTVNAMAFCFDEGHIDLFGGVTDLNKKSIKAVGDPDIRFREDALRMLRAVRFACELGFDIEPATLRAVEKNAKGIRQISKERIYSEFSRAVASRHPEKIHYLRSTGLGKKIHPMFRSLRYNNIPKDNDLISRMAYIMKQKETAIGILEFLKADKKTLFSVLKVLEGRSRISDDSKYCIRKLISEVGEANAKRVLILKGYDLGLYHEILRDNDCTSIADLIIDGSDLITTGIAKEGIDIRHILNRLLDEVMKDPAKNRFEVLLPIARQIKKEI
jgi:tRNA nucleotidyltransferase (CCA-adding enzyme)